MSGSLILVMNRTPISVAPSMTMQGVSLASVTHSLSTNSWPRLLCSATGISYRVLPVLKRKNMYSGTIAATVPKPLLNFNLPVALAFVAMLHAALYNVGIELTHLSQGVPIDEEVITQSGEAHAHHHHHHSVEEIDSSVQREMANCFFCLDGVASVGESPWVSISSFYPPPGDANTHLIFFALAASYSKSLARAPPAFLST